MTVRIQKQEMLSNDFNPHEREARDASSAAR